MNIEQESTQASELTHRIYDIETGLVSVIVSQNKVDTTLRELQRTYPPATFRVDPWHPLLKGKVLRASDVEWIVNNMGELGVKIGDQTFFLYKGESLMYTEGDVKYRTVEKREFGETTLAPDTSRYTSTSNGEPPVYDKDSMDWRWRSVDPLTADDTIGYTN